MPCITLSSRSGKRLLGAQDGLVFLSACFGEGYQWVLNSTVEQSIIMKKSGRCWRWRRDSWSTVLQMTGPNSACHQLVLFLPRPPNRVRNLLCNLRSFNYRRVQCLPPQKRYVRPKKEFSEKSISPIVVQNENFGRFLLNLEFNTTITSIY